MGLFALVNSPSWGWRWSAPAVTVYASKSCGKARMTVSQLTNSSAIAERPRCRVGQFGQKWKTIFSRQNRSIFNHCYVIVVVVVLSWVKAKLSNSVKYSKIMAITPFKVIQGHRCRHQSKDRIYAISTRWAIISGPFRFYRHNSDSRCYF